MPTHLQNVVRNIFVPIVCLFLGAGAPLIAQEKRKAPELPPPTHADAAYGPHPRNVVDVWLAKSDKPAPLVIYFHGGGFKGGDKHTLSAVLLKKCLERGFSVAAGNYRFTDTAPFPAQMHDAARAVQFLRSKAGEWNIDKARFAMTGGSAGAGISLWLAFHDDLADPKAQDPVARESTRLAAAGVFGAQCAYDPRWIKEHVGGQAHLHPALFPFFGVKEGEDPLTAERAFPLYKEASAINHLGPGDAPVWMLYSEPDGDLPPDAKPGQGIHHPRFGHELKKAMDKLGIFCTVRQTKDYAASRGPADVQGEMVDFFAKAFEAVR